MKTRLCFSYSKHWGMLLCMALIACNAEQSKLNNLYDLSSKEVLSDEPDEVYYDTTQGPILPPEYIEYVETPTSGLYKINQVNDIIWTAQYTPVSYLSIKENKKPLIDKSLLDSLNATYKGMEYFTLTFKHRDGRDLFKPNGNGKESELISYLDFGMQQDIYMTIGDDTLPCRLYHFERRTGVSPESKIMVGFPYIDNNHLPSTRSLIIKDKIFSQKDIQFNIKKEALLNLPEVRTETL